MSFPIGSKVEVIAPLYKGRWIYPGEQGVIEGRHCSPAGQEVYDVRLEDNKEYTLAPGDIKEVTNG